MTEAPRHLRLAIWLGLAGVLSTALLFPYLLAIMPQVLTGAEKVGVPFPALVALQLVQAGVVFTLMSWAGLRVGYPMGLDAPVLRAWVYRTPVRIERRALAFSVAIGLAAGALIVLLDQAIQPLMPAPKGAMPGGIERWKGFLASFYGGISEELQLRLFLMTMLAWIGCKLTGRGQAPPSGGVAWIAIMIAALAFAAGHLPAAAQLWPLDAVVVFRTIVLNMIVGVPCGWLFWRRGLEHAIAAHFGADMILHVVMAG